MGQDRTKRVDPPVLGLAGFVLLGMVLAPQGAEAQVQPDFTSRVVSVSPDPVISGRTVTVDVEVLDGSGTFAGNVRVSAGLVGRPLGFTQVFVQNGSGTAQVTFTLEVVGLLPGSNRIEVVADDNGAIVESSEANNASTATFMVQPAELVASGLDVPMEVFPGRDGRFRGTLRNDGPAPAINFAVWLDIDRQRVATTTITQLDPGQTRALEWTATMPADLDPGMQQVRLLVDIGQVVPETTEVNNVRLANVQVRAPAPDLTVSVVDAPETAEAGQSVPVQVALDNVGVDPAGTFTYSYRLEGGPTEPEVELLAAPVNMGLRAQRGVVVQDRLLLPAEMTSGRRRITIVADSTSQIDELDETNNVDSFELTVFEAPLRVFPRELPPAQVRTPYAVDFVAEGGTATPMFSIVDGLLPSGMVIDGDGRMLGRPLEGGLFDFVLRAEAGATVEVNRRLRVTQQAGQAQALPPAFVGRPYSVQLTDGLFGAGREYVPPLAFTTGAPLPIGASLAEDGLFQAEFLRPGTENLVIVMTDAVGQVRTAEANVQVLAADNRPQIASQDPPVGQVGVPYCDRRTFQFQAESGNGALRWRAEDPLPAGMQLGEDGTFCGTPTLAGNFDFVLRVDDEFGFFDTNLFRLVVEASGILVLPERLPEAPIGAPYAAQLSVVGPGGPYTFRLLTGAPPSGLTLADDGLISGVPDTAGRFPFAVAVDDPQGEVTTVPLSITVLAPQSLAELDVATSGCRCVGDRSPVGPGGWLLMLGVSVWLWRRRRACSE